MGFPCNYGGSVRHIPRGRVCTGRAGERGKNREGSAVVYLRGRRNRSAGAGESDLPVAGAAGRMDGEAGNSG